MLRHVPSVALGLLGAVAIAFTSALVQAQNTSAAPSPNHVPSSKQLEKEFFAALREGSADKILSYVSDRGVNVGSEAQHISRTDVEQQFRGHRGLYCKLFDSSCMQAPIDLGNSAKACSDRELLTDSQKVRTAASEVTRNGVQQAVLVAEVQNDRCPNTRLIDFIFNLDADGWKLFSMP